MLDNITNNEENFIITDQSHIDLVKSAENIELNLAGSDIEELNILARNFEKTHI